MNNNIPYGMVIRKERKSYKKIETTCKGTELVRKIHKIPHIKSETTISSDRQTYWEQEYTIWNGYSLRNPYEQEYKVWNDYSRISLKQFKKEKGYKDNRSKNNNK